LSSYVGDIAEDATVRFIFNTSAFATGAPITLAGTPAISVYKNSSTTQSTAGVTLAVDLDTVTGMHSVEIDTSADAFYAVNGDYFVVVTTGTVDGVSVVGKLVGEFSIENRDKASATALAVTDAVCDSILVDTGTTIPGTITTAQNDLDTLTGSDGATLATAQGNYAPAKAADILTTQLTEAYSADGVAPTLTEAIFLIQQVLTDFAISGTTNTIKKIDGSTQAAVLTHDDATTPTSSTRTS